MSGFGMPAPSNVYKTYDPALNTPVGEAATRLREEQAQATEERLERLLLVNAAMWELIREHTGFTEADLLAKVAEVDARDGTVDGKLTRRAIQCPKCQRTIFPRHNACMYCGETLPVESAFGII